MRIYNQWLIKAIRDNADPAKPERANTLWDLHICFSVGDDHTIKGRPVWLITDERKLREAAAEVTSTALVLAYNEYRQRLASGDVV